MVILFLLFVFLIGPGIYCNSQKIDCGSGEYYDNNSIYWESDVLYIRTGKDSQVLINTTIQSQQMNSLRFFSDWKKNCHILPVYSSRKQLIRDGFYHGNYDGLSKPPTFDLQLDGNVWTTVVTSLDEPSFFEVIIMPVARTVDGGVPFSSLEMLDLDDNMYDSMKANQALFKIYGLNFGATEMVRFPDDDYDRFWDPAKLACYKNVTADYPFLNQTVDEYPPLTVVQTAIEAFSPSDLINLSFPLQEIPVHICHTIFHRGSEARSRSE